MKEGLSEPKGAQNQEISVVCEISQPKLGPCENGHLLRNDFAALRCPLRNRGLAAKMDLYCEMISQPNTPLCKNFRSCETPSWHTSAISQHSNSISQLRNGCEIPIASNLQFSQPQPHFAGCFAAAKHPFGTRVPFRSTVALFRSCEMGCEIGCEKGPPLRKCPSVAKSALLCEN